MRERTEELTRLNAELGRAKAEAEEANISKTRFLAAASHDILQPLNAARLYVTTPGRAPGRRRGRRGWSATSTPRSKRSRRSSARCSTSRGSTPARCGRRSSASASTSCCASSRSNSRRWRARRASSSSSCRARSRCAPTGGCCAGCCRTSSPTRSSTRRRAACWSAAGARGGKLRIDVYDTGLGIPQSKQRDRSSANSTGSTGRQGGARPRPRPLDRRAHRARARSQDRSALERRARLAFLRRGAAVERRAVGRRRRAKPPRVDRGQLAGITVLCIDNEPKILDGMDDAARRLGLPGAQGAGSRRPRIAAIARVARPRRTACWSTTTSTAATASRRSPSCAGGSAPTCRRS